MQSCVAAVQHPVQVGSLPEDGPVETGAECLRIPSDVAESDAIEVAGLDQDRDATRDPGSDAHPLLAEAASEPESSE